MAKKSSTNRTTPEATGASADSAKNSRTNRQKQGKKKAASTTKPRSSRRKGKSNPTDSHVAAGTSRQVESERSSTTADAQKKQRTAAEYSEAFDTKEVPPVTANQQQKTRESEDILGRVLDLNRHLFDRYPDLQERLGAFWRGLLRTPSSTFETVLRDIILPTGIRRAQTAGEPENPNSPIDALKRKVSTSSERSSQVEPTVESVGAPSTTRLQNNRGNTESTRTGAEKPAKSTSTAKTTQPSTTPPRKSSGSAEPIIVNRRILSGEGLELAGAIAAMFQENPRSYQNGIPGDVLEVTLRLRRVLDQVERDWSIVKLLMRTVMPVTLRRLSSESVLSPEQAVDLITAVLDGLRPQILTQDQDSELLTFFAATRALLEQQKPSLTNEGRGGYYATRNAIGQYISSGRPSNSVLKNAVFYFEEILYEYYLLIHNDYNFKLRERDRRSLEVAGNNGGNHLDDLRHNADSAEIDRFWPQISGITVAVAVEEKRGMVSDAEIQQIRNCLSICFGEQEQEFAQLDKGFHIAVDVMMYGPGAWRSLFTSSQTIGMELSGALIRLVRSDRRADAPSTMFNLGVELIRFGEKSDGQRRPWERMLINTLGLWWSLYLGSDWGSSLTAFHGYPCLVNLWGAIADVKSELIETGSQFEVLVKQLYHWTKACEAIAPRELRNIERIHRSFNIIGSDFPAPSEPSNMSMESGRTVLRDLRKLIQRKIPAKSSGEQNDTLPAVTSTKTEMLTAVEVTAGDFHRVLSSVPDWRMIWSDMSEAVLRFVPEAGQTEQRIRERMVEIWGDNPDLELIADKSILVRSRIMTRDEYEGVRQQSRDSSRVADYLFVEDCTYSWLER